MIFFFPSKKDIYDFLLSLLNIKPDIVIILSQKPQALSMDLLLFSLISFLFSLLPLILFLFLHKNNLRKNPTAVPKPYPLLGTLPHFIKNRHRFLEWISEILNQSSVLHTMTIRTPIGTSGIITSNPLNVEHMLKTNFPNYPKGQRSFDMLQDFLGHGIFNSDGEHWKQQRKTASYEFNKRSLRNFVMDTVHHELVHRLIPLLSKAADKNRTVDLQDVLERFGFDNICKVAFGEDPGCLNEEEGEDSGLMRAFTDAQNLTMDRLMSAMESLWKFKKLLNIGSERRLKESIKIVHEYAMKIIKSKKINHKDEDLLSRFASNEEYTEELLRDNVISFILAGRETTSSALTWFFWILSSRPDVEKRILDEVKSIRERNLNFNETFSFDELREMNYLQAAITESMRLYPPVPLDTQSCLNDDIMPDGTFVGKNWFVTYCAYAMGRTESIWGEDCMVYKPERWLENGVFQPENPFKFPVFHAGPRMCLGKEMAYIQMKSIVASVVDKFEIQVLKDKDKIPEYVLSLTLRMKGGLPIKVRERMHGCRLSQT